MIIFRGSSWTWRLVCYIGIDRLNLYFVLFVRQYLKTTLIRISLPWIDYEHVLFQWLPAHDNFPPIIVDKNINSDCDTRIIRNGNRNKYIKNYILHFVKKLETSCRSGNTKKNAWSFGFGNTYSYTRST